MCHGKDIVINRQRFGTECSVFGLTGQKTTYVYQGKCAEKNCQKEFYPFHTTETTADGVVVRTMYPVKNEKYFGITSCSVFEVAYLEQVSQLVTRCNAEFINISSIYPGKLDYQVLEDAYLCYEIGIPYLQLITS